MYNKAIEIALIFGYMHNFFLFLCATPNFSFTNSTTYIRLFQCDLVILFFYDLAAWKNGFDITSSKLLEIKSIEKQSKYRPIAV